MPSPSKEQILQQLEELIALQEAAIGDHPTKTTDLYRKGRDAFIRGSTTAVESEWSRSLSLSLDDLSTMHRYMLSSSFMSAWYHLWGEKGQRDKAAHSCCMLVAGLRPDPDEVMKQYLYYEQLWRRMMKSEGIAPRKIYRLTFLVLIVLVLALGLWFLL